MGMHTTLKHDDVNRMIHKVQNVSLDQLLIRERKVVNLIRVVVLRFDLFIEIYFLLLLDLSLKDLN